MKLKTLRHISKRLADVKIKIGERKLWTMGEFTDGGLPPNEKFCLVGAFLWSQDDNNPDDCTDIAEKLLKSDALLLFNERLEKELPFPFDPRYQCPLVIVNDYLGFNAVHQLLDYTSQRVTNLILNYEHSANSD